MGLIIWVVRKLGLGIEVRSFGPAYVAAIVIAVFNGLITWLLGATGVTIGAGFLGAVVHLVIAAVILKLVGGFIMGTLRGVGFLDTPIHGLVS